MEEVKVGGRYRHFKGGQYIVIALARDSEDKNKFLVVYQAQYDSPEFGRNQVWVRELSDFVGYKELGPNRIKKFTSIE